MKSIGITACLLLASMSPGNLVASASATAAGESAAPGGAQQQGQSIFLVINSQQSAAAKAPPGTADGFANVLYERIWNRLKAAYPCYTIQDRQAVETMLGFERSRQLLGAGDDQVLAQVAGGLGARYVAAVNVNVFGDGNTGFSGSLLNAATARNLNKGAVTLTQTADVEVQDLDRYAAGFVSGLEGSLPKCPETIDVVTITDQGGGSGATEYGALNARMTLNMTCKLDRQTESEATCDVSYTSQMSVSDGNKATEHAQGKVTCAIVVDVGRSTTRLHVGMFRMKTTQEASLAIKDADGKVHRTSTSSEGQVELGGWDFEGPATPGRGGSTSGSGSFGTMKATWTVKAPFGG